MKVNNLLIIQNDEIETLGLYEQYLKDKGHDYHVLHAYEIKMHEAFPSVDDYDAFIVGPTPISVRDVGEYRFLTKEWKYLAEIIESGRPCIGVCCWGQLLARRLGAEVSRSPEVEVGGYEVHLTDHGEADPLFEGFPSAFPVFHWHSDMFTVPPGARLLAEGSLCPIQAFGLGNVMGFIFHLEIDSCESARWIEAHPDMLKTVGKTREQVIYECKERE